MSMRYFKELAERAMKTFAQVLVATLGAGATDLLSMPWRSAIVLALGATVLSVLTSVASAPFGAETTPSLVRPDKDG